MSLFKGPEEHAANPPETWTIERRGNRWWATLSQGGDVLEWHETKKAATESLSTGPSAVLYRQETDWYAGKTPPGWVTYESTQRARKEA